MKASGGVLIALVCIAAVLALPQEKQLSPAAEKLTEALAALKSAPNNPELQAAYIQAFPQNYKSFAALFDFRRELYDGDEFISVLPTLANVHQGEIGTLLVGLVKDAHYDADAENYLQNATAVFGAQHTGTFLSSMKLLSPLSQTHVVSFLAAGVEDFGTYPEYQEIINNLRKLGANPLARELEHQRKMQERRPHD